MPAFSHSSAAKLASCHADLQRLFNEVIKHWDCTVLYGNRSVAEQQALYAQGRTTPGDVVTDKDGVVRKSMHNSIPSLAVDVAPWPVDWHDLNRHYAFVGYVLGTAQQMGIRVRPGADWDRDRDFHDQTLYDLPHFELQQ